MFFTLSDVSGKKGIQAESTQRWNDKYISNIENFDLATKFQVRVVNRSLWAIHLGLCVLNPNVEYFIEKIDRSGLNLLIMHFAGDPCRQHLLPERYARMVWEKIYSK